MLKRLLTSQLPKRSQSVLLRYPSHTIAATVILTIGLFIPQVAMNWRTYEDFTRIRRQEQRLQHLSDRATYLDEVLTMSALMNAATGDRTWEQRYRQSAPELDAVIQESMNLVPEVYTSEDAKQIDAANQALIALETQSFQLVQQNQQQQALNLLTSSTYKIQKRIYADGVTQRNRKIQQQLQTQAENYQNALKWSWTLMATSLLLLLPTWLIVLKILRLYLRDRQIAESALQQKNQDLTEAMSQLQQAQRIIQTEKLSSLAQMVAGVAHEINNPINFIDGNLTYVEQYSGELLHLIELYQQNIPNPPAVVETQLAAIDLPFMAKDLQKLLRSMRLGTMRIEEIVAGLRIFSRLDESERKTVEIHAGLESAILLLQHRLNASLDHPEIQLVRDYGKLPPIACSPGQLNQVFHSLLSNAIEAIEQAKPTAPMIRIQTDVIDEHWVRIAIADNGTGISLEQQSKVFDPFFTTKPIGKGKGLGLSIAYQIITEYHHGKLYFASNQEQGTEFVMEIPLSSKV